MATFKVVKSIISTNTNIVEARTFLLVKKVWDDWYKFDTTYSLYFVDDQKDKIQIGSLKIGKFGMMGDRNDSPNRMPDIPIEFDNLDEHYFSLGQDSSYYNNLKVLGKELLNLALDGLNDVAKDLDLFYKAYEEKVMQDSLLRNVSITSIEEQFNRIATGGAELSRYDFQYIGSSDEENRVGPISLDFHVEPKSYPPTNIHVIIGRNGVGKTHLLNNMVLSILVNNEKFGKFESTNNEDSTKNIFAGVVFVTFSAFDKFGSIDTRNASNVNMNYNYIGLKSNKINIPKENSVAAKNGIIGESTEQLKNTSELKAEFISSIKHCKVHLKMERWKIAISILESDPVFKDKDFSAIAHKHLTLETTLKRAGDIYEKLSSGHKIVILTITRLVETVDERTLVLLDEPECHLHPPLLSAFIRSLSDLLIKTNGVAIIATHSPVVLQEVPKSCVWNINRSNDTTFVTRLSNETFGENVGRLTRDVFRLEVSKSGFNKLLIEACEKYDLNSYESVAKFFNGQLGLEAQSVLLNILKDRELPF